MKSKLLTTMLVLTVVTTNFTMDVHATEETPQQVEQPTEETQPVEVQPVGVEEIQPVEVEEVQYSIQESLKIEPEYNEERTGKPVILDMDFGSDVDDACALRLAGTMHLTGEIQLKAVTMSVLGQDDLNLKAAAGLLQSQSLTYIPIGKSSVPIYDESPYWQVLADSCTYSYEVYDSVKLWRKVISESERPVDICTTGYLGNLAEFCKSQPDGISDKTGMELLENVGNIYITGGTWTSGYDNNFWFYREARDAFDYIVKNVDKTLIFITNDVGGPILCGGDVVRADANDPLSKALVAWGADNGRAAWDPLAMYICATVDSERLLNENMFKALRMDITFDRESGLNQFTENINGKHIRVYRATDDLEYYRQKLDDLCKIRSVEAVVPDTEEIPIDVQAETPEEASSFMREG